MTSRRDILHSFRSRFWIFFAVMMVGTLGGVAIGIAGGVSLDYFRRGQPALNPKIFEGLHIITFAVTAFNFAVAFVVVFLFRVHAGAWGLRSYDFWGKYHEVEWGEMTEASPANLLGLRYLRVQTAGKRCTLWVPLFLAEQQHFCETVREHAGADHPLAVALEAHMA